MRAKITNTIDPDKLMRAQIKLVGTWDAVPDEACPWAEYLLPIGGAFVPCKVGDYVWVEFPYNGDTRRPLIVGAAQDAPGGTPNVPPESWGGPGYQPPAVEGAPDVSPNTPTEDFVYNRNGLLEHRSPNGSWSVTHMASNTTMGMNDTGQIYIITTQNAFIQADGGMKLKSGSDLDLEAAGNINLKAGGMLSSKSAAVEFKK
jgi:hypothetical protein